jgi:hypothetical protein
MSPRSNPQKQRDESTFPVRVILRLPGEGGFYATLGAGRDPHRWLSSQIGLANAALHGWRSPYIGEGFALYCRSLADAAAFLAAFPEFLIADGTASPVYDSPYVIGGRRRP